MATKLQISIFGNSAFWQSLLFFIQLPFGTFCLYAVWIYNSILPKDCFSSVEPAETGDVRGAGNYGARSLLIRYLCTDIYRDMEMVSKPNKVW